ncbi:MAG: hypothetical protein CMG74_07005 [Candidatus Marinimicrobia bacterium]|nr:hypothetical protein [Candidatus Neomarinimicrobiota bacterium]|tara:strand:- start:7593 stop:8225 length:633 start_codon:yes stop_codon:yes gene_type:complete
MLKLLKNSSLGMTLIELSAVIVVTSIIGLGMTSAAQAVMLHYQNDTVRQDLRQYGNNIMREITRELHLAQKVQLDGMNGFSRLKLYKQFQSLTPDLIISCREREGIEFDDDVPLNGTLKFPNRGVFRENGQRTIYIKDFNASYEPSNRPGMSEFKESFLHLELILSMESDVMDEAGPIDEDHYFYRTLFLGTAYIQMKITDSMGSDNNEV